MEEEKLERNQIYLVVFKDENVSCLGDVNGNHSFFYCSDKYRIAKLLQEDRVHVLTFPEMDRCAKVHFSIT